VGDIHGRLDLLEEMLGLIEADIAARPPRETFIVFLGDLIDRGSHSAQVMERLRTYRPGGATPLFLMGNHEEAMLRTVGGDEEMLRSWIKFGGAECLESYGVDVEALTRLDEREALRVVKRHVPDEHIRFLSEFGDTFLFGDYLFVHAGIRPGILLEEQSTRDLRWIRDPFLSDGADHGLVVVHGHTISPKVVERPNRIGIDTGAYLSGVLTSLAVEDEARWYLSTGRPPQPEQRQAEGAQGVAK
jgi:serine/threonine protein phosphatase 1